jgi:hypothetical protein
VRLSGDENGIDEISEQKRDASGPIYGAMKGLATIHGDLTEPLGAEWEALHQ